MLIKGINDREPVLRELAAALRRIGPDQVHLNVPIRPPAEDWVEPPDEAGLIRVIALLATAAPLIRPAESSSPWARGVSGVEDVIAVLRRHPLRHQELVSALRRWVPARADALLEGLATSSEARRHRYLDEDFWVYAGGRFAADPRPGAARRAPRSRLQTNQP